MKFITLEEILIIHDSMLEIGGGREGILDFTLLHSAIERPKAQFGGEFLYDSIFTMAGAMLHALVKNHPFLDGNKRTAFFTTLRLLNKNGYEIKAKKEDIVTFMVSVDTENRSLEEISAWLEKHTSPTPTP